MRSTELLSDHALCRYSCHLSFLCRLCRQNWSVSITSSVRWISCRLFVSRNRFDMPSYVHDSDSVWKLREEAEQLRVHASHRPMKVSQGVKDIVQYCNHHMNDDILIFPNKAENPFKGRKTCTIL